MTNISKFIRQVFIGDLVILCYVKAGAYDKGSLFKFFLIIFHLIIDFGEMTYIRSGTSYQLIFPLSVTFPRRNTNGMLIIN